MKSRILKCVGVALLVTSRFYENEIVSRDDFCIEKIQVIISEQDNIRIE